MPSNSTFLQIESGVHSGAFGNNPTPTPTDAQCKAGNYKLGRVTLHGMDIAIEQPRGTYRTGIDADGARWTTRMAAHYGYIAGTKGNDGDEVDCFIGFYPQSELAFVINQDVAGRFDEHKIMLCFPDEENARRAYADSYERGWLGLESIVPVSISQLKWWLKNGNMTRPLQPKHLPHEGLEAMTRRTQWNADALPQGQTLDQLLYDIRRSDAGEGLMLDSVSMADILEDSEGAYILDAMVVPKVGLERKMNALQRVMERAALTVRPVAKQISDPFTQRGVANITALFELSDGQTVTIFFHNPDVTPKKIADTDEVISWKWLLNKKDITIVVAPEHGEDLNINEVARRIMKLAEKNSPAFMRANAKRAERMQRLAGLEAEIKGLEVELKTAEHDLEAAKIEAEDRAARLANTPVAAPAQNLPAEFTRRGDYWNYTGDHVSEIAEVLELLVMKRANGQQMVSIPEHARSQMAQQLQSAGILAAFKDAPATQPPDSKIELGVTPEGREGAATESTPTPTPTYQFTDATDAFKQAATGGGSDFATAEKMDTKAKELGLKVSWSVGKALLDSATGESDNDEEDNDEEEDDFDVEGGDSEEEDFDAEEEFDAAPEFDSCGDEVPKPILDGDFKGHPFRGNQFKKVGHSSRAAVGSTLQAKTIERKGGTKKALKAAHKEAYYSHRAAMVSASGKTKRYHKKMAKFHAGRSGVEVLDSAAILDAAAGPQGLIGKVKKGVKIIGRISIGDDGKAMIFTGNTGKERVKTDEGKPAIWADDEAAGLLDYLVADLPSPTAKGGAMPIAKRNKLIDDFQNRQDSLSEGYKAIRELFKTMSVAKSAGKDVGIMAAADFAKAGDLLKSGQVTQVQYDEFAALYSETSGVPVSAVAPAPTPENKQDFFASLEPTPQEIEASKQRMGTRQRSGANDPRATSLFLTRANRLWLEKTNPEQAKRNDFAKLLESKGGKAWMSEGGEKHRIYIDHAPVSTRESFSGYFDVKSGDWMRRDGGIIQKDDPILKKFHEKLNGQTPLGRAVEPAPTPATPSGETPKKLFYVTMIRGDQVARLAGPFSTGEQAQLMIPRAQEEAHKVDPRSAFDPFGVTEISENNPKAGILNSQLGLPLTGVSGEPVSAKKSPQRIPQSLLDMGFTMIPNPLGGQQSQATWTSAESAPYVRITVKHTPNPDAYRVTKGGRYVTLISGENALPTQDVGIFGSEESLLVAVRAIMASARPAAPAPAPAQTPTEDPQMTSDRTLFQSVIDGTVTTSDGEGILSASLADTLEAAYLRHAGNAEMDDLFEKAINAYTEAELVASANL